MKRISLAALSLLTAAGIALSSVAAFAETIGYVDIERVVNGYDKAQGLISDLKVREAELRKMQADFIKQLEDAKKASAKNPVANTQLEKDLNDKLTAKLTEYRNWAASRQKEIDNSLDSAIKSTAQSKNIDVVLTKQAIYLGGTDITNDVINRLNSSAAAAPATSSAPAAKK